MSEPSWGRQHASAWRGPAATYADAAVTDDPRPGAGGDAWPLGGSAVSWAAAGVAAPAEPLISPVSPDDPDLHAALSRLPSMEDDPVAWDPRQGRFVPQAEAASSAGSDDPTVAADPT